MAKLVYRASLLGITYPEYDSDNAHRTWSNVKRAANHPPVEGVNKLTIDDLKTGGWRVKRVLDLEPSDIVEEPRHVLEWEWPHENLSRRPGLLKRVWLWILGVK